MRAFLFVLLAVPWLSIAGGVYWLRQRMLANEEAKHFRERFRKASQ